MPKTLVVSVYEVFGLFFVSCMPISIISGFCKNLGRMTISKQNKKKIPIPNHWNVAVAYIPSPSGSSIA